MIETWVIYLAIALTVLLATGLIIWVSARKRAAKMKKEIPPAEIIPDVPPHVSLSIDKVQHDHHLRSYTHLKRVAKAEARHGKMGK